MFPFDKNVLPQLPTRKGLLVIDFQNDFLAADGALSVTGPNDLVSNTLDLVKAFRKVGDIIWVCTEFDKPRPSADEQILATDVLPKPTIMARSRRRPAASTPEYDDAAIADADPEAFLSRPGPPIVHSTTSGAQLPAVVQEALAPRDITFIKSHYSAFKSGQLLQMLRVKFITELFLCGSLANIGVYATAVDAAKYGYSITLVENCCGYRSDLRQGNAVRSLVDVTGCEVEDSQDVIDKLQPKKNLPSRTPASSSPVVPKRLKETSGSLTPARDASSAKSIEEQMAGLKITNSSSSAAMTRTPGPTPTDFGRTIVHDTLEVDPAAQPPPPTRSDSPYKEASRIQPEGAQARETTATSPPALMRGKNVTKEPRILGTAVDSTSDFNSDLEPDSTPVSAETQETTMDGETDVEKNHLQATEPLCEGDTTVIYNVLPKPLAEGIFEKVRDEVRWQRMSHQGGEVPRLVAVQGEVASDGSMPVYRHPSDESPPLLPFSTTVLRIKTEVEKQLGHPLNHVLIQFYRDGTDYISEHSDKTLDIVKGSYIANVSLGAERTMVFRTKRRDKDPSSPELRSGEDSKQRKISRAKLPHNSLCRMGLKTNMCWLHAIKQDKRMDREKTPAELAFSGGRISLTFRQIGTFLDRDSTLIWGQGATGKTRDDAHSVINGQSPEAVGMLQAFGTENHSTKFDWDKHYGKGFDVLHMSTSPRFCASADPVVNMRIALMLAEYGISYSKGTMSSSFNWKDGKQPAEDTLTDAESPPVKFVDNDAAKSTVQGELAIMLYVEGVYGSGKSGVGIKAQSELARVLTRFQEGLALLDRWGRPERGNRDKREWKPPRRELAMWNSYAGEDDFIAGPTISLADFAVWPVLHAMVEESGIDSLATTSKLGEYYERVKVREPTAKMLGVSLSNGSEAA
ncbi:isochorismatase [Colletotrichum truncatum]|uniref:Isochorismatase n=1 Tax=Colletotrichum truncatum TaxID=5467 RepID=A0ACC3YFT7_COLTU|nr:isochorismatase [Colletotrichum truncatum]KAF6790072.1 isochorismatase [Colletotrichum truncatum]